MEIKEFIQNFADQFDYTPVESFTPETVFHDLDEYSSIIALSISSMLLFLKLLHILYQYSNKFPNFCESSLISEFILFGII